MPKTQQLTRSLEDYFSKTRKQTEINGRKDKKSKPNLQHIGRRTKTQITSLQETKRKRFEFNMEILKISQKSDPRYSQKVAISGRLEQYNEGGGGH